MMHTGSTEWYRQKTLELQRERYLMRECTEVGRIMNRAIEMFERALWSGMAPTMYPEGVQEISYSIYEDNIRRRIDMNVQLAANPRYIELMINSPGGSI